MAQMAIVKSAAGLDCWNRTSPSGSHASGDTGRRIWMIGSNARVKNFDRPRMNPSGVPMRRATAYPLATSTSEYHVNRRMP
jgi:hypothetical protein